MTDRTESDRACRKWTLLRRLDERRNLVRIGFRETWRKWPKRTQAEQNEIETVLALATHQLAECDRMEAKLKQ